jgi:uncharacterized protein (DUF2267 family)
MSMTGLRTFDETLHLSNVWLNELMDQLDWDDKQRAYRALRAVLHALRDRLTAHESVHLGAQLPMLIRGLYYENWHMKDAAPAERTKSAFLNHISAELRDPNIDSEESARQVFTLLAHKISPGEIEDVKRMLPPEIRALWPSAAH